jgi:hypothetical protein
MDATLRNEPAAAELWVGALSRGLERKEDILRARAQQIRPGVRESTVYKVALQQLQFAKKRHGQHKFTSADIGRAIRCHPSFGDVSYKKVHPVIKALEADGVIKKVPPSAGRSGSNTFVFG